jgi:hypothetical protein
MKTLEEKNRMIAEFMGATITDIKGIQKPIYYPIMGKSVFVNKLKYHTSWDWLMPVVEKIEQTNDGCTLVIIEDERCHIDNQKEFHIDSVGHTKIEAVHNAAVAFIEWYNENEKQ